MAGTETVCQTGTPSNEICDGNDNDCDGATDEYTLTSPATLALGSLGGVWRL